MKRIRMIIVLFLCFLLAGCVQVDVKLDVDKYGNASVTAKTLVDDYVMKMTNVQLKDMGNIDKYFDTVQDIAENGKKGIIGRKNMGNIVLLGLLGKGSGVSSQYKDDIKIVKQSSFLYTTYTIKLNVVQSILKKATEEQKLALAVGGKAIAINLNVNLPIALFSSNATTITSDKGMKSYYWHFTMADSDKAIQASIRIWNIKSVAIVIGITILLLALMILMLRRKRHYKGARNMT